MGTIKQNYANNITSGGDFDATDLSGTIPADNINNTSVSSVTTYGTAGSGVVSVSSDPPSPTIGDVWFNTAVNKFKYAGAGVGSWASGASLNTARGYMQGNGIQTAAQIAGGANPSGTPKANNELYDGTSWTEPTDGPAGKQNAASSGTQTASFLATGLQPWPNTSAVSYEWGGSSWTEIAEVNTARYGAVGLGSTEAALIGGGYSGINDPKVESFNGTSWTEVSDFNTGSPRERGGCGTLTAGLAAGGEPPATADTETWDGSSWTEVNNLNTANHGLRVCGTQTLALRCGGNGGVAHTEQWDGTSWTEVNELAEGMQQHGIGGTQTAAVIAGGDSPGITSAGQEWNFSVFETKQVTTS